VGSSASSEPRTLTIKTRRLHFGFWMPGAIGHFECRSGDGRRFEGSLDAPFLLVTRAEFFARHSLAGRASGIGYSLERAAFDFTLRIVVFMTLYFEDLH
jgi:hypothetical protein